MPFLPVFLLMAQGTPEIRVAVPIQHRRPSRVLHDARLLLPEGVRAEPDDAAGTLILTGPSDGIAEARTRFGLFDNAPRRARLEIHIESPTDHAEWNGRLDLVNNETWKGDDGATGVRLEIAPRLNDDNSCTVFLKARSADAKPVSVVLRVGYGKEQTLAMEGYGIRPTATRSKNLPRIAVRFVDTLDPSSVHP